jgi:hypothetical protein
MALGLPKCLLMGIDHRVFHPALFVQAASTAFSAPVGLTACINTDCMAGTDFLCCIGCAVPTSTMCKHLICSCVVS